MKPHQSSILILLGSTLLSWSISVDLAHAKPEKARRAATFIDSIGVAVHLSYTRTAYGNYSSIIKPRLKELGVRHIRDGLPFGDHDTRDKLKDLAKAGIKLTLVTDPRDVTKPNDVLTPSKGVKNAASIIEAVEAIEGPNEWDIHRHLQYQGKNFPEGIRKFQAELYSAVRNNSATAHLLVLSPSMANPNHALTLGKVACDINNMHSYPGGLMPATVDLDGWFIPKTRLLCGNKPIIVTEAGYHNAINTASTHKGISEQSAAKYLPRLFLRYFKRGIKRTFAYELIDVYANPEQNNKEHHFGLLRHDGSPKPAFIALKNLITLLEDGQSPNSHAFAAKSLDFTLNKKNFALDHLLLQKRDGVFYLVVWQAVPSYDLQARKDVFVAPKQVTLQLNTRISKAVIYQPNRSTQPLNRYISPTKINLAVPDHPVIIKLVPAK